LKAQQAHITRNLGLSVDEIGERYLLNHAITVQADCQAVVYGTIACKPLDYGTRIS